MSTWNIGNNAQNINIGRVGDGDGDATANQTVNPNAAAVEKAKPLFGSIVDSLPAEDRARLDQEVVQPLMTFAALPPEEMTPVVEEQSKGLIDRLRPYASKIGVAVAAFGEGALSAMASSNPVINGLLFAVRSWNQPSYQPSPWQPNNGGGGGSWSA